MMKINFKRKFHSSPGQALVEFALIATVLLMMIFLIIESARILWAWISVQHAAREGGRYAITGQYDPDCAVDGLTKFREPGGRDLCPAIPDPAKLRVASIVSVAHNQIDALPLNENSVAFEDENYYNIEVWGVNEFNELAYDYAGLPQMPVVVRVTYRVPIITPFFRPILPTIPVFGQVTMNNESFGQLGGISQGQGLPPEVPPIPTAGVTPSPSPSPTATYTPTPGATSTNTPTATPVICPVQFVTSHAIAGETPELQVTGDVGTIVTIFNLTDGHRELGVSGPLVPRDGLACAGSFVIPVDASLLRAGDVLLAESSDGSVDTIIVLAAPPTPTSSPTSTPTSSPTITPTPSTTPTATPGTAFIELRPSCGIGPLVQFNVFGGSWPGNDSINIFWNNNQFMTSIPAGHGGNFQRTLTINNVGNGNYTVRAVSSSGINRTATFRVPCSNVTSTPTPTTPTPTATPAPEDLVIVGPPTLVSTRPIIAYQPVQFSVVISNAGDIDVNNQFFVDLYLDPTAVITPGTIRIPVSESSGYAAVSSLAGGASRVITITSPVGFENEPQVHHVYGMVDSLEQIVESIETNNISPPLIEDDVRPGSTPTPIPTPGGSSTISGIVQVLISDLSPQRRALVKLINQTTGQVVTSTTTDANGLYTFNNVPAASTYTVTACVSIDNRPYFGIRTGITPPNLLTNVYMLPGPCS